MLWLNWQNPLSLGLRQNPLLLDPHQIQKLLDIRKRLRFKLRTLQQLEKVHRK
ncbi:hypothetical protein DPMN_104422 [Dreissena polymorpha]|uniref:Uncharacterized protein n=1 Tax=Dreissena polymorpha TaxID=45954 RepID=A0A9D4H9X9_DREPO|nr:hypothetical protein DPMN_104422 [Dreissena polymorpha]